jgi:hypothetical protein
MVHRARLAHIAVREGSFVSLSVLGAILFLNHQILYMTGERPSSLSWLAYAASTAVIYGFVRGIFLVGALRVPRVAQDPSVCPECGQLLADGTPLASRLAATEAPLAVRPARPSAAGTQVRLARPIVTPNPTVSTMEDVLNPSLDELLLKILAQNPPARPFANSAAPRQGPLAESSEPGEPR